MILTFSQFLTDTGFILLCIIAFVFVLGLIVLIHEFGHFIFAKRAGILCHEFAIGMGPVIYQKKKGETMYSIRAIPIGGFVSMAGEGVGDYLLSVDKEIGINLENNCIKEIILDENALADARGKLVSFDVYGQDCDMFIEIDNGERTTRYPVSDDAFYVEKRNRRIQISPYNRSFESKPLGKRFLSIVAGPLMNFILAAILYLIVGLAVGVPNNVSTKIGTISAGYPAETVLLENDSIQKINNVSVSTWDEFSNQLLILKNEGVTSFKMIVLRDGLEKELTLNPAFIFNNIGISSIGAAIDDPNEIGVTLGTVFGKSAASGVKEGHQLVAITIDDQQNEIKSWTDVYNILKNIDAVNVKLSYYESGNNNVLNATVESFGENLLSSQQVDKIQYIIGVSPEMNFNFVGGIANGMESFKNMNVQIVRTVGLLLGIGDGGNRQIGIGDLSGPIGIFGMMRSYLAAGFIPLISFAAMLSVNIGMINLLPIPALDGGRIVFLGYELITGKKLNKKLENTLNNVMFMLLMLLFVYIAFKDVVRIFG